MSDNEHDARDSVKQVAIERVAQAIQGSWPGIIAAWEAGTGDLHTLDNLDILDARDMATAAIQAYNAYLRERAKDDDVVEAAGEWILWACDVDALPDVRMQEAKDEAGDIITAALDAMIGKESNNDRG